MKTCTVDGCVRKHLARGYCGTHYNRLCQTPEQRHPKVTVPCARCHRPCDKEAGRSRRYVNRFCSLVCRDDYRAMCKLPALFVGTVVRPTQPEPAPPAARLWTAGTCRHCGVHFIDRQPGARYCSTRCGRRWWRKQLRDDVPHAVWAYVLKRDCWRCQICRRAIPTTLTVPHPKAPTVDHVVPRSQGGTHDPANLRAAHFRCNWGRSNRGGNEQLALIG